MAEWNSLWLLEGVSPLMEEFIFFHDFTMLIMSVVTVAAGLSLMGLFGISGVNLKISHGQLLETIWILGPLWCLIQVALPSLLILYLMEDSSEMGVTVKVTAHQWYWTYELSDFWNSATQEPLSFDSYMTNGEESDSFRLLDTDNVLCLPYMTWVRALVTSSDVIHSWALPALGIKVDANPGRLSQVRLISVRPGMYFGQCSEICGANHSFMPIAVQFLSAQDYILWAQEKASE